MRLHKFGNHFYGVGVEWADAIQQLILDHLECFSIIEFIPENFFEKENRKFLCHLRDANTPAMVHGVELSIGTDEPLKEEHFLNILRVADEVNTIHLSDHLCMTEAGGVEIGQLTPLPWTIKSADVVCRKIEQIQSRIKVPFLIENITNRFVIPGADLTEPQFINRITQRTGCGLLLDMNNIHTNAYNFNFDPFEWMDAIDLEAVQAVHLAGGHLDDEGSLIDSHSSIAPPPVWNLYRHLCERVRPACTIVEWTDNTPPIQILINEVEQARLVLAQASRISLPRRVPGPRTEATL